MALKGSVNWLSVGLEEPQYFFVLWTPPGPHRITPLALKNSSVTFWGLLSFTVNYCIQCKSPPVLREISASREYGTVQIRNRWGL